MLCVGVDAIAEICFLQSIDYVVHEVNPDLILVVSCSVDSNALHMCKAVYCSVPVSSDGNRCVSKSNSRGLNDVTAGKPSVTYTSCSFSAQKPQFNDGVNTTLNLAGRYSTVLAKWINMIQIHIISFFVILLGQ